MSDQPPILPIQIQDVELGSVELQQAVSPKDLQLRTVSLEEIKETSAQTIGHSIVAVFAGAILLALVFDFLVVVLMIYRGASAADLESVTTKSFLPLLEKTATFASTVFGPLLAFILGYYFSEKARGSSDTTKCS